MLQPKDIDWLMEKKQDLYICCLQENHFRPRDTYRVKVRGWKTDIPCKWKSKGSWSSNSHITQNRLLNKDYYKRQKKKNTT